MKLSKKKTMKRFLLISTIERNITYRFYDTKIDAHDTMRKEVIQACGGTEEDFEEYEDIGDAEIIQNAAYVTDGTNHDNYDWLIVDLAEAKK